MITLDLEQYLPKEEIVLFDLKDHLFMGLILKEKDFRQALTQLNWTQYQDKLVALTCTVDAIIPVWAYMLAATYLQPVARQVYQGTAAEMYKDQVLTNIRSIDAAGYDGERIVIKGCGDVAIEAYAYAEITRVLRPHARSIMYGEPCSTVPVYKKKA